MTITINGTTGLAGVDGSASTPAVQGGDTNTGVFFPAADTVAIATGATERVRTDSSGNVGIGTSSPGAKLEVSGTATNIFLRSTDAADATLRYYVNGTEVATARGKSGGAYVIETLGSERARIDSSGNLFVNSLITSTTGSAANVTCSGTTGQLFRSTSSLKYKREVQDSAHGLAEVMALRSVTYKGKSEADGDKVFGGLIAEEVHAAGLTEFVQYAEDGTPDALAYSNMVSLAFKAIQEQQALIESLIARIAALEQA